MRLNLRNAVIRRLQRHCWKPKPDPTKADMFDASTSSNAAVSSIQIGLIGFIHWTYNLRTDLRVSIRKLVTDALLAVGTAARGRKGDCGNSRRHVKLFLMVLEALFKGMRVSPTDVRANAVISELATKVLLPLHEPDEFEEWRDQIPAIQSYHAALLSCIQVALSKHCTAAAESAQPESSQMNRTCLTPAAPTLRVRVVQLLLSTSYWPSAFQSNTPKELLFISELESLVELMTIAEFEAVQDDVMVSFGCFANESESEGLNVGKIDPAGQMLWLQREL